MRLALLHYSVPPVVGGVESVLAQHARLMTQAGHSVRLLAARGEALSEAIPLHCLPRLDSKHPEVLAVKAELDAGCVPATFEPLVRAILADLQPALANVDVLIAHNVCSLNKNLALTAAIQRLTQNPNAPQLILWHHDLAWTTLRYREELHEGYPWDLLRTDWGAGAGTGVRQVTVSELRRRELAELLKVSLDKITVVPNGVEVSHLLKLEPETQALVEKLRLDKAAPLLLLPARLTPRKNIELALRTLAALHQRRPQAALLVTGPEGPHNPANAGYKQRLLALRESLGLQGAAHFAVEYSGASQAEGLPDAVVADLFRLADALFFPSREEGFGIPLLEAALTRLPVFCADVAPLPEIGGEEVHYFSPDAEPQAVAELIDSTLNADSAYRFAARARQSYAWTRIYDQHIEPLLQSLTYT